MFMAIANIVVATATQNDATHETLADGLTHLHSVRFGRER